MKRPQVQKKMQEEKRQKTEIPKHSQAIRK